MKNKTIISLTLGIVVSCFSSHAQLVKVEISPEQYQQNMIKAHVEAPDFQLMDLEGNTVSLTEFRGKWIVLDFWGSWCGWCIRGIPEMKNVYSELHDKGLEIIGIDCGDTPEVWREAVAKYDMPWVNVYNPDARESNVTKSYFVMGYPTKVIIDPEGRIFDIITGEDPEFYTLLRQAVLEGNFREEDAR